MSPRAKLEILCAVLLGLLLGALDQTIVGTALPTIVSDLGGQTLYVWTVTIYLPLRSGADHARSAAPDPLAEGPRGDGASGH